MTLRDKVISEIQRKASEEKKIREKMFLLGLVKAIEDHSESYGFLNSDVVLLN